MWPDCQTDGILEQTLIETCQVSQELKDHAVQATEVARNVHGAQIKDHALPKAHFGVLRAWHEEHPTAYGHAVERGLINPNAPQWLPFYRWMERMFGLKQPV